MPVSCEISDCSASLWHSFLTQNQIINEVNIFCRVGLRGLPIPVSLLTAGVTFSAAC